MSDNKHTKGPWKATRSDRTKGADEWFITANIVDHNGERDICSIPGGASTTSGGNARLIAAAPELLDALKAMLALVKDHPDFQGRDHIGLGIQVNNAIDKAEGRRS
jgi:hypothetical protein